MCGISGYIAPKRHSISSLKHLLNAARHRGPDDEGYVLFSGHDLQPTIFSGADTPKPNNSGHPIWFPIDQKELYGDGEVGFAHRRLSILDISPYGHQPMSYNNDYWITYNGEIYNYLELRTELETLGHHFFTQTDTEVILASYAQWGSSCLAKFNGMWAFAILDRKNRKVFMARDRFGVKPFYYWISPESVFYFASEIKQFTGAAGWKAVLNSQRAYDYLAWGITDHTDETLFKGVYHLRASHFAEVSLDQINLKTSARINTTQWYDIPKSINKLTFDEAALDFKKTLIDSVSLRLRSDVPVGSCLSGGLDSSSIVCIMRNLLKLSGSTNEQKVFSSLSNNEEINEEKWVRIVTDHTKAQDYSVYPNPENIFETLESLIWCQDEPFGSTSIYAQWLVFELASKNNVRVVLDGQGADEQLMGYKNAIGVRLSSLLLSGRLKQVWREVRILKNDYGHSYISQIMLLAGSTFPAFLQDIFRGLAKKSISKPIWINWEHLQAQTKAPYKINEKSLKDYCYNQLMSNNLQMLLHWEDRNSMAHGIESRVPFLDYRLVELSMNIPDDYKFFDGVTKRILREAMNDVLPPAIKNRKDKIGFGTAEKQWIRYDQPDLFRKKLADSIKYSRGILNLECFKILEDIIDGRRPFDFVVWRMICFGHWMKVFGVEREA